MSSRVEASVRRRHWDRSSRSARRCRAECRERGLEGVGTNPRKIIGRPEEALTGTQTTAHSAFCAASRSASACSGCSRSSAFRSQEIESGGLHIDKVFGAGECRGQRHCALLQPTRCGEGTARHRALRHRLSASRGSRNGDARVAGVPGACVAFAAVEGIGMAAIPHLTIEAALAFDAGRLRAQDRRP